MQGTEAARDRTARSADLEPDTELSDDELEHVVGGLMRPWAEPNLMAGAPVPPTAPREGIAC